MGYMGFGMRKIDYTRKPKRAFEKLRKFHDADYDGRLSTPLDIDVNAISWQKHSYKPFDEWKSYKIIKRIIVFGPLLYLIIMLLQYAAS